MVSLKQLEELIYFRMEQLSITEYNQAKSISIESSKIKALYFLFGFFYFSELCFFGCSVAAKFIPIRNDMWDSFVI